MLLHIYCIMAESKKYAFKEEELKRTFISDIKKIIQRLKTEIILFINATNRGLNQVKEAFLDLGLFRRFSGLRKLEGKRVVIYARSLYDQVYKNVVITERIEGLVIKVDSYGITLAKARTVQYVNDEPTKVMHTPSEKVLVYHDIIDRIYIL